MTEQIDIEELEGARALFEAYCVAVKGVAYNGEAIPEWDGIPAKVRFGWVSAYREARKLLGHKQCASGKAITH